MTLYKVRMFVNRHITRGRNKGSFERVEFREEVIVDNLGRARNVYNDLKKGVECYNYSGYSGKVELFIPHIHENGELANWPDNDEYIERYEFPKE